MWVLRNDVNTIFVFSFHIQGLTTNDNEQSAKTCGYLAIATNVATIVFYVVGIIIAIIIAVAL